LPRHGIDAAQISVKTKIEELEIHILDVDVASALVIAIDRSGEPHLPVLVFLIQDFLGRQLRALNGCLDVIPHAFGIIDHEQHVDVAKISRNVTESSKLSDNLSRSAEALTAVARKASIRAFLRVGGIDAGVAEHRDFVQRPRAEALLIKNWEARNVPIPRLNGRLVLFASTLAASFNFAPWLVP
jgi:hypothetical protein